MLKLAILLAVVAIGAPPAFGQPAPAQQDPALSKTVLRPRGDAKVEVRNLNYRGSDGVALPFDLYFDPKQSGPRPVLILNSGTGDARGWGGFRDFGRLAAERGFVAIVAVKRFARGPDGIRSGREDTLALIRQLLTLAPDIADPNRACLWGFSGGGTTLSAAYGPEKPQLACVIGFYPAVSLSSFSSDADWLATYSPAHVAARNGGPNSPRTLIVRAGKDSAQLNGMIADFAAKALEQNMPVTIVNLPDAVHAFDWFDDTDWARQAMEDSFAFARRHTQRRR